jgi:hypothetical protein
VLDVDESAIGSLTSKCRVESFAPTCAERFADMLRHREILEIIDRAVFPDESWPGLVAHQPGVG